jgi:hypothetical protein
MGKQQSSSEPTELRLRYMESSDLASVDGSPELGEDEPPVRAYGSWTHRRSELMEETALAVRDTARLEGAVGPEVLESISASERIETRLGPLDFADGAPTQAIREGCIISRTTRS